MTALRVGVSSPFTRLHVWAVIAAIASALGLAAVMSPPDGRLLSALKNHDIQLNAISQRAERIRDFSRYIRKASLTSQADVDLPFAGHVGAARLVEPGSILKLGGPDGHELEIVTARKIPQAIALTAAPASSIDLMLITGRAVGAPGGPIVRLLVAVTPDKSSADKPVGGPVVSPVGAVEHQTL